MIIKLIWPRCEFQNGSWSNEPVASYWVECTFQEAKDKVFPFVDEVQIKKAHQIENDNITKKDRVYFLVSKNLKPIQSFAWHYPYSGQWNAYCPFRKIDDIKIENLEEIKNCIAL